MSKVSNNNYISIQGWMRHELNLKGNELMVYAIIYGFSQDGENDFTGSAAYMADWIGSTKQTVFNILKSLTERGLIKKTDVYNNGVKFCHYSAIPLVKNFDRGVVKNFDGGDQKILPNNIDINNINNIDNIYSPAQKGQMDFPKRANGSVQKGEPIPYINTDINTDSNTYIGAKPKAPKETKRFTPPTVDEVKAYCRERNNNIDAEYFVDYYEARNWELNKGRKVKDWKACVRTWEHNDFKRNGKKTNIETNQSFGDELTRSQDDLCRMIGFNV
jgi:predicted transcriptional regulator